MSQQTIDQQDQYRTPDEDLAPQQDVRDVRMERGPGTAGHGTRDVDEDRVAQLRRVLATEGQEQAAAFAGTTHQEELRQAEQDHDRERQQRLSEWRERQHEEILREEQRHQQQEAQRQEQQRQHLEEHEQVRQDQVMGREEREQQKVPDHEQGAREGQEAQPAEKEPTHAERAFAVAQEAKDREQAQEREGLSR